METNDCCNNLGKIMVSDKIFIEYRNILFSAKIILVMFRLKQFGLKTFVYQIDFVLG